LTPIGALLFTLVITHIFAHITHLFFVAAATKKRFPWDAKDMGNDKAIYRGLVAFQEIEPIQNLANFRRGLFLDES